MKSTRSIEEERGHFVKDQWRRESFSDIVFHVTTYKLNYRLHEIGKKSLILICTSMMSSSVFCVLFAALSYIFILGPFSLSSQSYAGY